MPGFWRANARSTDVYSCAFGGDACPGGAHVRACGKGYQGPICKTCEWPGFYLDRGARLCRVCGDKSKVLVVLVYSLLAVSVASGALYFEWWIGAHKVKKRASKFYRASHMARLKILYVACQIISSVEASLDLKFPYPFNKLLAFLNLFQLDLGLLPLACVAKYEYFESLLVATLVPLGLIALIALAAGLRAHFALDAKMKADILAQHTKAALMLCFVTHPTSSATIFEILRPCDHYSYEGSFLPIDHSKRCNTAIHRSFVAFGIAMLLVITFGMVVLFTTLLYKNRHRVCPSAKDELTKLRIRDAEKSLAPIDFLFKDYRSSCLYMEPVELARRAIMVGAVRFCGEKALRCGVGAMLALLSIFLYDKVTPYSDSQTNILASAAQYVVFFVYLAAFIIVAQPV
jgi:hypothetical protein